MAWVQDRHGVGRYKTAACKNRDNIEFNESCTFFVDKLDVVRIMVFETAMVGHVDIPMAEFFPLSPPALSLGTMCYSAAANQIPPSHNNNNNNNNNNNISNNNNNNNVMPNMS